MSISLLLQKIDDLKKSGKIHFAQLDSTLDELLREKREHMRLVLLNPGSMSERRHYEIADQYSRIDNRIKTWNS